MNRRSIAWSISCKALLLACLFCLQATDKALTFTVAFVPLRLGLANLLLLAALSYRLSQLALFLMSVKIIFVFFVSGPLAALLSLAGTTAAFASMYFAFKLFDLFNRAEKGDLTRANFSQTDFSQANSLPAASAREKFVRANFAKADKHSRSDKPSKADKHSKFGKHLQTGALLEFLQRNKIAVISIFAACCHMAAQLTVIAYLFKINFFKLPLYILLLFIIAALSGLAVGLCWQILDEQSIIRKIWQLLSAVSEQRQVAVRAVDNRKKYRTTLIPLVSLVTVFMFGALLYVAGYNFADLRQALMSGSLSFGSLSPYTSSGVDSEQRSGNFEQERNKQDGDKQSEGKQDRGKQNGNNGAAKESNYGSDKVSDRSVDRSDNARYNKGKVATKLQTHLFGKYLDTAVTYTGYDGETLSFEAQCRLIEARLRRYDSLFDAYSLPTDGQLNLRALNLGAYKETLAVDAELYDLIAEAASYYDLTAGAFNPFIGKLSEIQKLLLKLPDSVNIPALYAQYRQAAQELRKLFGISPARQLNSTALIALDAEKHTVRFLQDIKLDLGAIAKAYVSRAIITALQEAGVESALLNIGGSISNIGTKTAERHWLIALERPRQPAWFSTAEAERLNDNLPTATQIELPSTAATFSVSGTYERQTSFEIDGQIIYLNHLLDSSVFASSDLHLQVAVLAEEPLVSDVLATACFSIAERDRIVSLLETLAKSKKSDITLVLTENDGTSYRYTASK